MLNVLLECINLCTKISWFKIWLQQWKYLSKYTRSVLLMVYKKILLSLRLSQKTKPSSFQFMGETNNHCMDLHVYSMHTYFIYCSNLHYCCLGPYKQITGMLHFLCINNVTHLIHMITKLNLQLLKQSYSAWGT